MKTRKAYRMIERIKSWLFEEPDLTEEGKEIATAYERAQLLRAEARLRDREDAEKWRSREVPEALEPEPEPSSNPT